MFNKRVLVHDRLCHIIEIDECGQDSLAFQVEFDTTDDPLAEVEDRRWFSQREIGTYHFAWMRVSLRTSARGFIQLSMALKTIKEETEVAEEAEREADLSEEEPMGQETPDWGDEQEQPQERDWEEEQRTNVYVDPLSSRPTSPAADWPPSRLEDPGGWFNKCEHCCRTWEEPEPPNGMCAHCSLRVVPAWRIRPRDGQEKVQVGSFGESYSICNICGLTWPLPEPHGGICTRCKNAVSTTTRTIGVLNRECGRPDTLETAQLLQLGVGATAPTTEDVVNRAVLAAFSEDFSDPQQQTKKAKKQDMFSVINGRPRWLLPRLMSNNMAWWKCTLCAGSKWVDDMHLNTPGHWRRQEEWLAERKEEGNTARLRDRSRSQRRARHNRGSRGAYAFLMAEAEDALAALEARPAARREGPQEPGVARPSTSSSSSFCPRTPSKVQAGVDNWDQLQGRRRKASYAESNLSVAAKTPQPTTAGQAPV